MPVRTVSMSLAEANELEVQVRIQFRTLAATLITSVGTLRLHLAQYSVLTSTYCAVGPNDPIVNQAHGARPPSYIGVGGTTSVGRRGHVGDPCATVGQEKELTGEARAASNHNKQRRRGDTKRAISNWSTGESPNC